jgi:protein subunit release factor A
MAVKNPNDVKINNYDVEMTIFYPAIPSTSRAYRVTVKLKHVPTGVEVLAEGKSHSKTKREAVEKLYEEVGKALNDK